MVVRVGFCRMLCYNRDMKNILVIAVAALLAGCFTSMTSKTVKYPAPPAPIGCVLVDAYDAGRPKDYVKFHNAGMYESLKIDVLFHNPATMTWEAFGIATLKGPGDTDTMKHSTHLGGGLRNLRYFAVKFLDGKPHEFSIDGAHNDLHLYVK